MFHGHCMDNKNLRFYLKKRRETLVQTVRVVLGLMTLLWSKPCGSIAEIMKQ